MRRSSQLASFDPGWPDLEATLTGSSADRCPPPAELFGPAPAPIARVRARYRVRMLVRAPRQAPLQSAIAEWLASAPKAPTNLRLAVDIDPQSFL